MSVRRISARFAGALKKSRGAILKSFVKEYEMSSSETERKWQTKITRQSSNSSSSSNSTSGSWSVSVNITNASAETTTKRPFATTTSTSAASKKPKSYSIEPGDEAVWALKWVRVELKKRVTRAKENLVKVQEESQTWTMESLPKVRGVTIPLLTGSKSGFGG